MSIDDLARLIAEPAIEYRPELRWWLAEGLHTDETLRFEIDTAHRLGFGGMEFLAMDELDDRPQPLRLGRRRVGARLADRRRGDDEAEHVGELHLGHQLVERQPADYRSGSPGGGQGTERHDR